MFYPIFADPTCHIPPLISMVSSVFRSHPSSSVGFKKIVFSVPCSILRDKSCFRNSLAFISPVCSPTSLSCMHESEVGEQTGEMKAKEFRKQLLSLKIEQGTEKTIFLNPTELEGCDLNTLETIDINGGIWQVGSAKIG